MTGRTGSGKSTLCKLLLRMYPVADGMLYFRGEDVNRLARPTSVPASPMWAKNRWSLPTPRRQYCFWRPEASMAEIEAAARAAAIDEDIRTFADGYQAVIGERASSSPAATATAGPGPALLCDRPMLIIDDALSAIDVETEQQVLQGILAGLAGKSVLLISHRINVLRHAERIVVLDEGRIVAEGRHEDLLATPFYA
jgi:ATP-binding cassette subfamily B protein